MFKTMLAAAVAFAAVAAATANADGRDRRPPDEGAGGKLRFLSVGSGGLKGGYYSTARRICEGVNRARAGELRCSPEATQGSLYNIAALRRGDIEFALVQSDWQHHAYEGTSVFAEIGPMADMRAVASLYVESVTILARREAGVRRFRDLAGKRVDVGHPSSGRRATAGVIMDEAGLSPADFERLYELRGSAIVPALCAGEIDATVLVVGHPSATAASALADCDVEAVPMAGAAVDAYLARSPFYIRAEIPAGLYPRIEASVPTVGVVASLVTRADVPDAAVTALLGEVLAIRGAAHGPGSLIERRSTEWLMNAGRSAPLHPAAQRALSEAGE